MTSPSVMNSNFGPRETMPVLNANAPIDLAWLLRIFVKHVRVFILAFVLVFLAVLFITLAGAPRYTATATLLINERASDVLHMNNVLPQQGFESVQTADSSAVDTQVAILQSRSLAGSVVDQLGLENDPEFNLALRPGAKAPLVLNPTLAAEQTRENVITNVLAGLNVKRAGATYTVDLKYTALEPDKAAAIANAFLQNYLTQILNSKADESHSATGWLDTRLGQLKQDVQVANAAVEQYKIEHNLMTSSGATLTEQEITNVDTQLAQARAQEAEQDARLRTAQSQLAAGSNGGDVGEALNSGVISNLRAQRAQQSAVVADLQSRYGYDHPQLIKAQKSLADLDSQIQTEIGRVISNLKAQSQIAHTRTASLAGSVSNSKASLANNTRATVQLDELVTNATAAQGIYDAFLSRYKEALAKEGAQPGDAKVVTQAKLPTSPSSPVARLDFAIAFILGSAAGFAAVLISELLSPGVSSVTDVEVAFDLPAIGELPTLASTLKRRFQGGSRPRSPVQYVVDKPLSRFAESFRNLRTSALSARPGKKIQVIAVTSSLPKEGKTTTTLCLARTMALSGTSVVVVDCDLRQRSINRLVRTESKFGLIEVLNGAATVDQALVKDPESPAALLLVSESTFTPRDVFGTEAMERLLTDLRNRFDVVLLDTPPVLAVADTRVLCPSADVVLFLVKWRKTSRKAATSALRSLATDSIYIGGVVITQINVREQARSGEGAGNYYRAIDSYYTG